MLTVKLVPGQTASGATVTDPAATWGDVAGDTEIAVFVGSSITDRRAGVQVREAVKKLAALITRKPAAAPGAGSVSVYSVVANQAPHLYSRDVQLNATAVTETQFGIAVGNTAAAKLNASGVFCRAVDLALSRYTRGVARRV